MIEKNTYLQINKSHFFKLGENFVEKNSYNFFFSCKKISYLSIHKYFKIESKFMHEI